MIRTDPIVRRSPIYYGWLVWGIATLGMIATSPGQSFTVSLFIDFFITDFDLDRTTVSAFYSLGTFIGSLSLTYVGRLIDRFGSRYMTTIIAALFAVVLLLWSLVASPIGLLLGFIAIRGLGQGALGLASSNATAQWFRSRRGRMASYTMVLFALFQSVYIPWLQRQLEIYDWRQVWIMLGLVIAVLVVPLTWLLMRDTPEKYGLEPDGVVTTPEQQAAALDTEEHWTLVEALRTSIFWIFLLGRLLIPAWVTGLVLHQVSIFAALGHSAQVAAETYALMQIFTAGVALAAGYMVDRFRPHYIMALQMSTVALLFVLAMVMTTDVLLVMYAAVLGLVMGIGPVFDGAVWPNLFGRRYLGEIRGFISTGLVLGTALGPIPFGLSYDLTGSYAPVLWVGIVLAVLSVFASFFARKPPRRVVAS